MKMSSKLTNVLATGPIAGALPLAATAGSVSAGPGACNTGQMCLSELGGGQGQWYQFATNDSALNNNDYANGTQVSDHNVSARDRISGTTRVCVYKDFNYSGGTTGYANYTGATWVTLNSNLGSSIRYRTSATC